MDPSIQAFLDRLDATLVAHSASIATIQAQTAKIDDLVAWRPDLEKRVTKLGAAVTALQQERPSSSSTPTVALPMEKHQSPHPATPIGPEPGAGGAIHGSHDHGVFAITRGLPAASFRTPPPLPTNGQSYPIPPTAPLSPFAHASSLLTGWWQAHPSITCPQFSGENPNLWKTMCEQYFQMFGILPSFWVPMAALNFSGSAVVWLQSIQKRLADFDWMLLLPYSIPGLVAIGIRR